MGSRCAGTRPAGGKANICTSRPMFRCNTIVVFVAMILAAAPALAQRPDIPAQAIAAPALDIVPVEQAEAIELPDGMVLEQVASVDIDKRGHLFVLHRGDEPLLEFDSEGHFLRAFGRGLFERAHSLLIDADGNFWVTDVAANIVVKLDAQGHPLMTLGTAGQAGEWDEAAGLRRFDQPTDVAIGPDGSIFVTQGHNRGDPRVLKFAPDGRFIKSWGGRGSLPWQFAVAHSIAIDARGQVYVADRENRRVLIFDLDGNFLRGWVYRGMACSLYLGDDSKIYMVTGFDGQVVELDRNGNVLGVIGRPGKGLGEFGEAHDIVVSPQGDVFVADVENMRLQKFVARRR